MTKELKINLSESPNNNYIKFFNKFKEISTLDIKEWNGTHVLGYFIHKYEETYGAKYKFKYNTTAPSKCFEVFQIRRLGLMLSSDPKVLKNYIDWVFENKIIKPKKRITSVSYLNKEDNLKEFKNNCFIEDKVKINRSTSLPDDVKKMFNDIGYGISSYGELAFLSLMTNKPEALKNAFIKISELGISQETLNKIV